MPYYSSRKHNMYKNVAKLRQAENKFLYKSFGNVSQRWLHVWMQVYNFMKLFFFCPLFVPKNICDTEMFHILQAKQNMS